MLKIRLLKTFCLALFYILPDLWSPWQLRVLQVRLSWSSPSLHCPPEGHSRCLRWMPPPHEALQRLQSNQSPHPDPKETIKLYFYLKLIIISHYEKYQTEI